MFGNFNVWASITSVAYLKWWRAVTKHRPVDCRFWYQDRSIESRSSIVRIERELSKGETIRLCIVGDVRKSPYSGQCTGIPITFEQTMLCYYGLSEGSHPTTCKTSCSSCLNHQYSPSLTNPRHQSKTSCQNARCSAEHRGSNPSILIQQYSCNWIADQ
jgi:hypothetical protein